MLRLRSQDLGSYLPIVSSPARYFSRHPSSKGLICRYTRYYLVREVKEEEATDIGPANLPPGDRISIVHRSPK